jgi:transposase
MGRPKGVKNKTESRYWSKEAKYEYVKLVLSGEYSAMELGRKNNVSHGMISNWIRKYNEGGIEALENKRKPGNPLTKFSHRKQLSELEQLQYENMKLRIENERLKKGYTTKEVMEIKLKRKSKANTKS